MSTQAKANETAANETAANSNNEVNLHGRVVRHERNADEAGNVTHFIELRQKAKADEKNAPSYLITDRGEGSDERCKGIKKDDYVEAKACVAYSGDYTSAYTLVSIKKVSKLRALVNAVKLLGKIATDSDDGQIVKIVNFRAGGKHGLVAIELDDGKKYTVRFHGKKAIEAAEKFSAEDEVEIKAHLGVRYSMFKGRKKKNVEIIVNDMKKVNAQETSEETEEVSEDVAAA